MRYCSPWLNSLIACPAHCSCSPSVDQHHHQHAGDQHQESAQSQVHLKIPASGPIEKQIDETNNDAKTKGAQPKAADALVLAMKLGENRRPHPLQLLRAGIGKHGGAIDTLTRGRQLQLLRELLTA